MTTVLSRAVACALVLVAAPARADGWEMTWLPGAARAIPRTTSASRDTPLLEYTYTDRAMASLGLEPGLFTFARRAAGAQGDAAPAHELHIGIYGMAALENDGDSSPLPHDYWRGLAGVTFTYAPLGLARTIFGPGAAVEFGFVLGHESDHRSDAQPAVGAIDQSSLFQNFVGGDVGVRVPIRNAVTLVARVSHRVNAPSTFTQDVGADLEIRVIALRYVRPFVASHGEVLFASAPTPNAPSLRTLVGLAVPGRYGEVSAFASFEGGADRGLLYVERGFHVGGGLRYTPF